MIRIGICDDEKVYRDLMAEYLREFFGEENIEYIVFEKGEEVMQYRQVLDFLFLDIEMEGLDGIQIKNILEERFVSAKIVFMTSHDERMPEAFGTNVVDFIVKPLEKERVQNSFRRLQKFFHSENICVMVDGREVSLPANDILYIEAEDKYTYVYTARDKYLVRGPLSEWEKKLPKPQFCRCSRFYIINMEYYDQKNRCAVFGAKRVTIGRTYLNTMMHAYRDYLRGKAKREND